MKGTGFWIDGQFCPPGLFGFVGYGEQGTIVEGLPIFEPRIVEMRPDLSQFTAMLERASIGDPPPCS